MWTSSRIAGPSSYRAGVVFLFEVDHIRTIEASSIAVLSLETGEWRTIAEGGSYPKRSDGSEIFFRSQRSMVVASIAYEPVFSAGLPEALFRDPYYRPSGRSYAVSPDGQRFLMVQEVPSAENDARATPQIRAILTTSWSLP